LTEESSDSRALQLSHSADFYIYAAVVVPFRVKDAFIS